MGGEELTAVAPLRRCFQPKHRFCAIPRGDIGRIPAYSSVPVVPSVPSCVDLGARGTHGLIVREERAPFWDRWDAEDAQGATFLMVMSRRRPPGSL